MTLIIESLNKLLSGDKKEWKRNRLVHRHVFFSAAVDELVAVYTIQMKEISQTNRIFLDWRRLTPHLVTSLQPNTTNLRVCHLWTSRTVSNPNRTEGQEGGDHAALPENYLLIKVRSCFKLNAFNGEAAAVSNVQSALAASSCSALHESSVLSCKKPAVIGNTGVVGGLLVGGKSLSPRQQCF